jgi:hypothetical protein
MEIFALLLSISDWVYTLTPLYSHYIFLHVSAFKGPSSGSTNTFYEQGEQNVCCMLRSSCQTAV